MALRLASPLSGEILTRDQRVRFVAALHPMQQGRVDLTLPAGHSIAELLTEALGRTSPSRLVGDFAISVDGMAVPRAWWPRVRPKPGATVVARARLHGDDALKTVLTFAVVIAATLVAGPAAGLLGLTAGTALFTGVSAAITLGLTVAGTLVLNALFPPSTAQLAPAANAGSDFKTLVSIQGARNEARQYDPIPQVLGVHRLSPFYGAAPYTEAIGDDQYLRLLFVWGYGPLDISDLKIGETPLSAYGDYEIEHRYGYADDAPLTLYPNDVSETALSIALSSAAGYVSQTTAPDADEISIDIAAPQGIYEVADDGSLGWYQVTVNAQYRPAGSTEAWINLLPAHINFGRANKTVRLSARATVARGQYEVRVLKETADANSDRIRDSVVWTALRTFTNTPPIAFAKPLAMTALRIRATDQLNGVLDTFNGVVSSKVTAYDGADWNADTVSQNPADVFRHVLQGAANPRPRADGDISLATLQDWWSYCDANGFTFNQVVTNAVSVYDQLATIAAAGRAVPTFIDGKWGVVWDRPDDTLVQQFTPRNSWGFAGSRKYQHLPHAWRVRFVNADNGWTEDERSVYDDGYDASSATLFESIEFPGVTDPELIWRHGRFHIAQARLRPETFTLFTDWENIACTRGDRVSVQHDVALIGQVSGRVKAVDGNTVTLDETVTMEADKSYGIRFRLADGTQGRLNVVLAIGEHTAVTVIGDLPSSADASLAAGDLFSFGEAELETANYRVLAIAFQADLVAQLTLVDDAPAISIADSGAIPAYDPHVTLPADPFTLAPQDLRYVEYTEGFGANAVALVRLSWTIPRKGKVVAFEVQNRDETNAAAAVWRTVATVPWPTTSYDVPLIAAGSWSYRVRCLFDDGTASGWAALPTLNLQALLTPPDAVSNFRASYDRQTGRTYLTWDAIDDNRGILYEIRKGASWDAALVVGEAITQPKFQTVGDDTYWIAGYVVTAFGLKIYSATKHSIALSGSVLTQNVVRSKDERAANWDGYFGGTAGRDDVSNYARTAGATNFLAQTDVLAVASLLDAGGQGAGFYHSKTIVDAGRSMPCRVSVDYSATGVPAAADFLGDADLLNNPDFLASYLTQYIRVYPVIRTGAAAEPDVFAPSDIFAEDDAFAAGIAWGDWQKWSPDVYVGRFFQIGLQFDILDASVGAIAYALSFSWVVDVEDRLDRYQDLTVPAGGLAIVFTPTGAATATPFQGGIDNQPLPHILTDLVDRPNGYQVKIVDLTLAGCTVKVLDSAGNDVGGAGVNLFAQGY